MKRGRPAKGPSVVENLEGSKQAKDRLRVILETVTGERDVDEACEKLGIGRSAFYELRARALQATLSDLEPKPAGRTRTEIPAEQVEIEKLKRMNDKLLAKIEIAHVREELMLAMPEVFEPASEKKTTGVRGRQKTEQRKKRKKRKEMKKKSKRK